MGSRKRLMAEKLKEQKKVTAVAKLNDVPTSPRKMRLVADTVRGVEVNRALDLLKFSKREAAGRLAVLLKSAIVNWEAKNPEKSKELDNGNVIVKTIMVDPGRTLKRIRPCPQGRAGRIRKRSNHVTLFVNPISNRIGITRGWDSNWCGGNYAEKIAEDYEIRKYLNNRLAKASISKIIIERTLKLITVTIYAARPGFIIGKGGTEVDKLKEELKKVTKKDVQINIYEVKKPEVDAHIVADSIARQIEGRVSYRRAIKMAVANTMRVGAEGIKVQISGRVGGAEMARSEMFKEGRTPLHTFRADIDYALSVANTKVGALGVKVWICNGEKYGKQDLTPAALAASNAQAAGAGRQGGRSDRGGRRGDRRPRRDNK